MTPKIYMIPGMGTAGEIFKFLELPDVEIHFLNFPEPNPNETLSEYALRMAQPIPENEEPFILGMSMGGFIAQEIAAQRKFKKVILRSSLRSGQPWQLPLRIIRATRLTKILPGHTIKSIILFGLKVMGIPKKWKKELLDMTRSFSGNYFKFASDRLLNWSGANVEGEIVQIHGTKDEVFPWRHSSPTTNIQ